MGNDCTRNCRIAGGLIGLAVALWVVLVGGLSLLAGLFLGIVAGWLMAGLLVWGLCQGRGGAAENGGLTDAGWRDQPFTPTRRVVAPGGEVVSEGPAALDAERPRSVPLEQVSLRPGDEVRPIGAEAAVPEAAPPMPGAVALRGNAGEDGGVAVPAPPVSGGAAVMPGTEAMAVAEAPDDRVVWAEVPRNEDADGVSATPSTLAARPAAVPPAPVAEAHEALRPVESESEQVALGAAGAATPLVDAEAGGSGADEGGIEPLKRKKDKQARREEKEARREEKDREAKERKAAEKAARGEKQGKGKKRGDVDGVALPRVETLAAEPAMLDREGPAQPDPAADAESGAADDLGRIEGVGPMLRDWLAQNGVTSFAQIAAWDDAEISRFAGMMGRMGHRIRTEDWVGQARALAAERGEP